MTGLLPEGSENQEVLRITRLPAWSPVVSAELPSSGPSWKQAALELLDHHAGRSVGWWSEHPLEVRALQVSSATLEALALGTFLGLSGCSCHTSTLGTTPTSQRAAERFRQDNAYTSLNPASAPKVLQKWRLL